MKTQKPNFIQQNKRYKRCKKLIFIHFQESLKKASIPNIKSVKTLLKRKETPIFESHFKNEI